MRNYIHGELSEWSKVQHSKCCVPKRNLGFESLTLRQKVRKTSGFAGLFFFARLLKICSKLWKEQPVFWKEQGDFGHFGVFEPLKSVLSAIV